MNESCHIYEWVMSHSRMSHVTRMNESCHMYKWVMSHAWMSHVWNFGFWGSLPRAEEIGDEFFRLHSIHLWYIRICDMTHSYMWHASFIHVTWLIHICDMPHLYMWHASFINVTLLMCASLWMCDYRGYTCNMTRSCTYMTHSSRGHNAETDGCSNRCSYIHIYMY